MQLLSCVLTPGGNNIVSMYCTSLVVFWPLVGITVLYQCTRSVVFWPLVGITFLYQCNSSVVFWFLVKITFLYKKSSVVFWPLMQIHSWISAISQYYFVISALGYRKVKLQYISSPVTSLNFDLFWGNYY